MWFHVEIKMFLKYTCRCYLFSFKFWFVLADRAFVSPRNVSA